MAKALNSNGAASDAERQTVTFTRRQAEQLFAEIASVVAARNRQQTIERDLRGKTFAFARKLSIPQSTFARITIESEPALAESLLPVLRETCTNAFIQWAGPELNPGVTVRMDAPRCWPNFRPLFLKSFR
jgi:hypothetical protein